MPITPHLLRHLLERQDYDAALDLLSPQLEGQPNTRKAILSGWRTFFKWVDQQGQGVLNVPDPQAFAWTYAAWLEKEYRGVAASINNRLTQARRLYQVLEEMNLVQVNPFGYVHGRVNPAHERRQIYTEAELELLLGHANAEDTTLLLLGAHAGLTGPEVMTLTWEDVVENRSKIHLHARGSQQKKTASPTITDRRVRSVPCTPLLQEALQALAMHCGETPLLGQPASGLLFRQEARPLTDAQLRARIYWLCQRAEVPYKAWRGLRAAAGVRMVQEGTSRDEVLRTLGIGGRMALRPALKLAGKGNERGKRGIKRS